MSAITEPMTVCLCRTSLAAGGAERQAVVLASALSCAGFDVHVVCSHLDGKHGHYAPLLQASRVTLHLLNSRDVAAGARFVKHHPLLYAPFSCFSLPHIDFFALLGKFLAIRPHIVHCYSGAPNCIGGCAGVCAGVPGILLSGRNPDPQSEENPLADWARPVYTYLHDQPNVRLEANSHYGAQAWARWLNIPSAEITVSHNGINPDNFVKAGAARRAFARRGLGLDHDAPVILYTARNYAQKRPWDMLAVAALCAGSIPNVRFLAVGGGFGPDGSFAQAVHKQGLGETIQLLGIRTDMPDLLAAADALLLTSQFEGLPNAVMEAMCARLPVVSTKAGGELVRHGEEGFIHDVGDINGMADSLARLCNDRAMRQSMGEKGRNRIDRDFTVDALMERTLRQYNALLGR